MLHLFFILTDSERRITHSLSIKDLINELCIRIYWGVAHNLKKRGNPHVEPFVIMPRKTKKGGSLQ